MNKRADLLERLQGSFYMVLGAGFVVFLQWITQTQVRWYTVIVWAFVWVGYDYLANWLKYREPSRAKLK